MTHRLSPPEITELLGAHAVDALEPWESVQVEAHLRRDPEALHELEEHRQTLALLGAAVAGGEEPPPELWLRIAGELPAAPPPLRLVASGEAAWAQAAGKERRARRALAWVAGLAVAAVVAVVVLVGASTFGGEGATLDELAAAAADAPGAEELALARVEDPAAVEASITLLPDGAGYVRHDLPALPPGRSYQLWAVVGDEVVSAGLLAGPGEVAPIRVAGDVAAFAITEEVAGGVAVSANPPLAVWQRDA